jgi:hypothetical protein
MTVDFKAISGLGTRMQSTDAFQSYKSGAATGSQFYNAGWVAGAVTTTNNETINNYLLLYDKVRQELFLRPKDTDFVVQADKSQVKSFTITKDAAHQFVHAGAYDAALADDFFEVLTQGTNYSLFKLTKTRLEKADYSDMLKVKTGDMNDAFVDEVTYYVYHNNTLEKIALKANAARKVLSDQPVKVDAYLSEHKRESFNEAMLTGLVAALN